MYDYRLLILCCCIASTALLYPSLFPTPAKYSKAHSRALEIVTATYQSYHRLAHKELDKMRTSYERLAAQSKRLGKGVGYTAKLDQLALAEENNAEVAHAIANLAIQQYGLDSTAGQAGSVFRVREALGVRGLYSDAWHYYGRSG